MFVNPRRRINRHAPVNIDPHCLRGRTVLVRSALDLRSPPVALRGSIELRETDAETLVGITLDYPQMFQSPKHRRTIWLSDDEVDALTASEHEGALEFTIPGEL